MLLTKRNDVVITGNSVTWDPAQEPSDKFKLEATASTGYTDFSGIENFDLYGSHVGDVSTIRGELDTLYQATTWTSLTVDEQKVISKWFLASKADRDTVHSAVEQEINAHELCIDTALESVTDAVNDIKDAEPSDIDNMLDTLKSAIWNVVADSFAELYMTNNSTDTVITTVSTFVKIEGATTQGFASADFTHANNKLTYTGTKTKKFKVNVTTTTVRATGSGDKLGRFAIYRTGSKYTKTLSGIRDIGLPRETTFQGVIDMATNDYIEMFVENRTDAEDFTIQNMMVIAVEIKE